VTATTIQMAARAKAKDRVAFLRDAMEPFSLDPPRT